VNILRVVGPPLELDLAIQMVSLVANLLPAPVKPMLLVIPVRLEPAVIGAPAIPSVLRKVRPTAAIPL